VADDFKGSRIVSEHEMNLKKQLGSQEAYKPDPDCLKFLILYLNSLVLGHLRADLLNNFHVLFKGL
jgi:hypothetical protein